MKPNTDLKDGVRPFSNGSEFRDWQHRNCESCKKYSGRSEYPTCDLDAWLLNAYMGYGYVPADVARRMGREDENLGEQCGEREERFTPARN